MPPTDRLPAYVPESEEEAAFLRSYDPSSFPRTFTTVDIIVLTIRNGELCVPLVKRGASPTAAGGRCPAVSSSPTRRCTTPRCASCRRRPG